jgi:ABC-type transporter MlaC component
MLSPEQVKQAVEEFKALFKQQYGKELSEEEATKLALGVLQLFVDIYPLPPVAQR